jgi:hypothetical protein
VKTVFLINLINTILRNTRELLWRVGILSTVRLMAISFAMLLLSGCTGLGNENSDNSYVASPPLPGVTPIRAAPSVPLKRRVIPTPAAANSESMSDVKVWLYVSLASQNHLMKLGAAPSTGARTWENYLRASDIPFARITNPVDLSHLVSPGVLILPSAPVLSDAEKLFVLAWRNHGGSVLSTWLTGTHSIDGEWLGHDFMRDVLDVELGGSTQDEMNDTFMVVHGDSPVSHTLAAGTRVWLERAPGQLPLRLVGRHEAAQVMNWSRSFDAKKPASLISYNERKMPSGRYSRTVTLGYPEQNWQRSDPKQLTAITDDIFAWLSRQPRAYLGGWPFPYQSGLLLALQAVNPMTESEVAIAKTIFDMGGRATFYVHGGNSTASVPMIKKVQTLGHEIGYLGDKFQGFKDQPAAEQAERLDKMQRQLEDADIVVPMPASFSAPMDSYDNTTQLLLQEKKFDNYLAFMDVSDGRLPFLADKLETTIGSTVVLPRTLIGPEDAIEKDPVSGLDNFLGGLDLSARMGSLSVVRVTSQSLLRPEQRKRIFEKMQSMRGNAWIASARQVAQWWRNRERVVISLDSHPQGYVLSATVTRAVTVQEPLSIWVNLPNRNSRVRLQALQKGGKLPVVMAVDPWRSVITWRAPLAGKYAWLLKFEESVGHESF